ncbi:uncharacterized protein UTRI_06381_B [Ustilago trichophora]|uniref:Uncharacterized protein n=1 Tax=Ustilago trichophora TaxID=86804 RepID=A0A5C3EQ81_9BASI|nr:uncharacterized protein UTRI_06381_B [Ustilago trichophora]
MSFSTAFQSLRLPARSIHLSRRIAAPSGSSRASSSRSSSSSGSSSSSSSDSRRLPHIARRSTPAAQHHAPHGHLDEGVAGPSRCFCTSHRREKASELPLEDLRFQSELDTYQHDPLSTSTNYWQPAETSRSILRPAASNVQTSQLPHHISQKGADSTSPPIQSLLASNRSHQSTRDSCRNDFFTPSVQQDTQHDLAPAKTISNSTKQHIAQIPHPTYIDSLDAKQREALDGRTRLLLRSGEHSMEALSAEYGHLSMQDREQVCCHIMTQCVKGAEDARVVWDLYSTWTSTSQVATTIQPGPLRTMLRRMQGDTLYLCATYLHAAGLTRQAAMVVGDPRLKPSQSRYLLERLVYDLKLQPTLNAAHHPTNLSDLSRNASSTQQLSTHNFAAADARIAVREICDAMINLMADGVSFKRKTVNRTLKLLALTRARSRVARLLRAAQRRAQIDLIAETGVDRGYGGELRAAGGFSRLRTEEVKPPQVISTKVMEEVIRLLSTQDSTGARTAYEVLSALDPSQRSPAMYDALMTVYGNVAIPSVSAGQSTNTSTEPSTGHATVGEQLWTDILTLPHIGGPTLHTLSARIVCHARTRKLDLIKSDLAYLRDCQLGTIHSLTENAKLSIVRCCIESGSLLTGYRYATLLLRPTIVTHDHLFQARIINTLLRAAQHIHIPPNGSSSTPSRAQLLKRFLRHFSHLHQRFPQLQPGLESLKLFIELLDGHQQWIETDTLWNMLRVVGRHFETKDPRLVRVLQAFVKVFESRGETNSADELRGLIEKLNSQP